MTLNLFQSSFLSSLNPSSIFNVTAIAQPVMYSVSSILLVGSLAFQAVFSHPSRIVRDEIVRRSVDTFVATESPIALRDLLCNIGSSGACVPGAASGLVIASPDSTNPDCKFKNETYVILVHVLICKDFYTWTRDSALTFKCIVDTFAQSYSASLQTEIQNYIVAQANLQTVSNPSSGAGLGEPKFNADGSAFTGSWGRPQRDGPALRATALIAYSKWLIANGYTSTASTVVWPIIQNDLNYVGQYWSIFR
jgi:glucoamylase